MTDTERRIGYVELGEKLDSMNGRLQKLEEKVTSINVVVENNLAGERSVWAAIEKLTKSIDGQDPSERTGDYKRKDVQRTRIVAIILATLIRFADERYKRA